MRPENVEQARNRGIENEAGCERSAVIMDNPLALMQIRRLAKETGANWDQRYIGAHQIPDWEAVAMAWIERGVDPEAEPNRMSTTR